MSREFSGPNEIGQFVEENFDIQDASIVPDPSMALLLGGILCKYELLTGHAWQENMIEAEYERQRAADALHGRVRQRNAFISRFKRITDLRDPFNSEVYRKTWEHRGLVDPAVEHEFETGLVRPYLAESGVLEFIGLGMIRGNLEGKGSFDASSGRRLSTEFGAELRMPVANGQTIDIMGGIKDGAERVVDCFENRMNTVHLINDTYFVNGVAKFAAQAMRVQDRVKTYSTGAVVGTEQLRNEMEQGKYRPGFEAVLISSVHRLARLELGRVVEDAYHLLADRGVLLVSGPVARMASGNTTADEAIADAMEVFGTPEQVRDSNIKRSHGIVAHRQAIFRRAVN